MTRSLLGCRTLCLGFFFAVPTLLAAQTPAPTKCEVDDTSTLQPMRQVALDASWNTVKFDGGAGKDTITWEGPSFFLPRPENLVSIEVIDLNNGLFDTVVVNAEMVQSTSKGELEIISDWFDQVVLDPTVTWSRSIDDAFSSQLFTSDDVEPQVTVRIPLNTFVIGNPNLLMQTKEGPLGNFSIGPSGAADVSFSSDQVSSITFSWPQGGVITPDFKDVDPETTTIMLNLRNRMPDTIVIDPAVLTGSVPRQISVESDKYDRWVVLQKECWEALEGDQQIPPTFVFNAGQPTEIKLVGENNDTNQQLTVFTKGVASVPGYRHLSADSRYSVDAIDLRNGGKDILIIRNDGHLRQGLPVFIEGDKGIDEIWLEGTAGWETEYHEFGIMASTPFGAAGDFTIMFAPGLKLAFLPKPDFLDDPKMLLLTSYPGLTDEAGKGRALHVTRAGFVGFSARQLLDRSRLSLVNGIRNVIRINPEIFSDAATDVTIAGDSSYDVLLSENMPEPTIEMPGRVVWHIDRDEGRQTITAIDFAYIQYSLSD